jgi:glycosyltransferase involved in cell wall biosynthesis
MIKTAKTNNRSGLYVLGSLYPYVTGGMEIFNYYFLNRQLRGSKDAVYYLAENRADTDTGYFLPLKRLWPARLFYPFQFFFAVLKLRKKLNYAYLSYAEESWLLSFARSLTLRFFNIPYFVTIHWGKEPDWKFGYPFKYYFRHAHAVVGVSEPICKAFKKTIPAQDFIYIPPLIPFQHASRDKSAAKEYLGYLNHEKILLFVGSLKPMKNPDQLVEAFRIIGPAFLETHRIRLILAGIGEMTNKLRETVEKYELGAYIRFEGLVNRENMPDYYRAADFYIISSDYEGTSLSLLEAMFNGLTIIGSDAPGINRMLQHETNALLYETKNTEQLAETLIRIYGDAPLAKKISEKAQTDYNSRYSYEAMVEKYQLLFASA